jgi:hypothetical protein
LFNEDLYQGCEQIYSVKIIVRDNFIQFPEIRVPNDQGSFAQWCYGTPPTCKEGNKIACLSANSGPGRVHTGNP